MLSLIQCSSCSKLIFLSQVCMYQWRTVWASALCFLCGKCLNPKISAARHFFVCVSVYLFLLFCVTKSFESLWANIWACIDEVYWLWFNWLSGLVRWEVKLEGRVECSAAITGDFSQVCYYLMAHFTSKLSHLETRIKCSTSFIFKSQIQEKFLAHWILNSL